MGYFAVLLWREYKRNGNQRALDTLIAYNIEDVINLEYLMYYAFNAKVKELSLFQDTMLLEVPSPPNIEIEPDIDLVNKLKEYVSKLGN